MKAVVSPRAAPTSDPSCFVDATVLDPGPLAGHDLLVRVEAVSVNPPPRTARLGVRPTLMRIWVCQSLVSNARICSHALHNA